MSSLFACIRRAGMMVGPRLVGGGYGLVFGGREGWLTCVVGKVSLVLL